MAERKRERGHGYGYRRTARFKRAREHSAEKQLFKYRRQYRRAEMATTPPPAARLIQGAVIGAAAYRGKQAVEQKREENRRERYGKHKAARSARRSVKGRKQAFLSSRPAIYIPAHGKRNGRVCHSTSTKAPRRLRIFQTQAKTQGKGAA